MKTFVKYSGITLVILLLQAPAWAQDAATDAAAKGGESATSEGYFFWGVATVILFLIFFIFTVVMRTATIGKQAEEAVPGESFWTRMDRKFFTKAIPVEKEKDHLLDHDYDGIQELDNSLPPWWKYGFYFTIAVAIIYFLRFHVLDMGPTPEDEYKAEMSMAAVQIEEYRKASGETVDEKTVTMADAAGIEDGAKVFAQSCIACHGAKGEGGVGPNLTDDFWLHGGKINDVFKTIKFGVPDKGMQAWEKMLSPTQIKNISSYIKSIRGTNPPNAKAPQGEPFAEEAAPAADEKSK